MKMKMLAGVAAAALFTAPGAMAQDIGWYGAVDFGYHWLEDIEVESAELGTFEPEVDGAVPADVLGHGARRGEDRSRGDARKQFKFHVL